MSATSSGPESPHPRYDAILLYSFGGPEGPEEVMPFLRNVVRGRGVPDERLLKVAEHYQHFGGKSPINDLNRALIERIGEVLAARGITLPIYFGNRHWHPMIEGTLRQMKQDGVRRALAFVTSAFSSYSGCRAYREDLARALSAVGEGAPEVDKVRIFYNHPGFIEANVAHLQEAVLELPEARRVGARILFTAHSVPMSMARTSRYEAQLKQAGEWVYRGLRDRLGEAAPARWELIYQSRSGPPQVPWLEPDICDRLEAIAEEEPGAAVILHPLGFVSDHMEVVWDLDHEAKEVAEAEGLRFVRAKSAGTHPLFHAAIGDLIEQRLRSLPVRDALSKPEPDVCAPGCCPRPARPKRPGGRPS